MLPPAICRWLGRCPWFLKLLYMDGVDRLIDWCLLQPDAAQGGSLQPDAGAAAVVHRPLI